MSPRIRRLTRLSVSASIGVVFVSAGASKLLRPGAVRHVVESYRILPERALDPVARALGPIELATGVMLIVAPSIGIDRQTRALAGSELLLFSGVIAAALIRGIRVPCGCGPIVGDHVIGPATVVRNLALVGLLISPAFRSAIRPAHPNVGSP